jgi:hypothetical protein
VKQPFTLSLLDWVSIIAIILIVILALCAGNQY